MNYKVLKKLFSDHESSCPDFHLTAYITFSSFGPEDTKEYPWEARTYIVSSDNKAFQADKGGYSIFGSSLDGAACCVRLEHYMAEEHGGKDGWIVEDCWIVSYLLIECSDCNISIPKLFNARNDAVEYMLTQLAEKGELDVEKLKKDYSATQELFEDGMYGAGKDTAWLATQYEDWHWNIQPTYISSPLNVSFEHE